nr:hypothetical protein [Tanacetum cinerariifolium]
MGMTCDYAGRNGGKRKRCTAATNSMCLGLRKKYRLNLKNDMPLKINTYSIPASFKGVISNKSNVNTIGKKKQTEVSRKGVSNFNPFNMLNSVENDDGLDTNGRISKLAGKKANSGVSLSNHKFFHVTSSSTSTTPIVERIDKRERQIIDEKLTLLDDDGKLLPKVISMVNEDSDSEVEDVVDEHDVFMASKSLKSGTTTK